MKRDGFDRMDVATDLHTDPKFRLLARRAPAVAAPALAAYVALLGESWREGSRLTLEEAWPAIFPYNESAVDAMRDVRLVDGELRIPEPVWDGWFGAASERRRVGRERQHRADVKRGRVSTSASQPDRQSVSPSGRSIDGPQSGPTLDHGPTADGVEGPTTDVVPCAKCGEPIHSVDEVVAPDPEGRPVHLHKACFDETVAA